MEKKKQVKKSAQKKVAQKKQVSKKSDKEVKVSKFFRMEETRLYQVITKVDFSKIKFRIGNSIQEFLELDNITNVDDCGEAVVFTEKQGRIDIDSMVIWKVTTNDKFLNIVADSDKMFKSILKFGYLGCISIHKLQ